MWGTMRCNSPCPHPKQIIQVDVAGAGFRGGQRRECLSDGEWENTKVNFGEGRKAAQTQGADHSVQRDLMGTAGRPLSWRYRTGLRMSPQAGAQHETLNTCSFPKRKSQRRISSGKSRIIRLYSKLTQTGARSDWVADELVRSPNHCIHRGRGCCHPEKPR